MEFDAIGFGFANNFALTLQIVQSNAALARYQT